MSIHSKFGISDLVRRWRLAVLLAAALVSAGAIACSSGDDDAPAATNTPAASTGAATTGANGSPIGDLAITVDEGDIGSYLVGPNGLTLYIFTQDAPDTTNCTGSCLDVWPPLLLEDGQEIEAGPGIDGDFDTIDTPSGVQVTYRSAPLYYFVSDNAPGDVTGHLVGNVWFVARPDTASTAVVNVSSDGDYLIGPDGMTLYFFDNDADGVSNCAGQCLANWPALVVPEGLEPTAVSDADGELEVIVRADDSTRQVTYDGMPLYYYIGDSVPGDTSGDGVGGVWTLATP
jgi:predicted lipoprotein with Yx(FWY)xxD motif